MAHRRNQQCAVRNRQKRAWFFRDLMGSWGFGVCMDDTLTHRPLLGDFSDEVKFAEAIAFYPGCSPFAKDNSPQKIS